MNEENSINPKELLKAIAKGEKQLQRGKLKIFLGMAAGVGKTYAMLEDVQRLQSQGSDVVVGIVNTHGRTDTAKLLEGLKSVPPKKIVYKEVVFEELDLDELIKIHPEVAVVDELAHTNVPGSRHAKRWQDVNELLDNGIDVFTTLNVQHIESLKDVVENITGITIRETVPDSILDNAAQIELIDLTPSELLKRLNEGKVYLGEQPKIAAEHFFKEDRLMALRELAMRYAAEKVDHDLHEMVSTIPRKEHWKTREKLLVAISPKAYAQRLIRLTRRLAHHLDAPWVAVYVDDGKTLDESEKSMLARSIALARDLGAEVVTTADTNVASAIGRIARHHNVTQVVIGRSKKKWFGLSLVDQLYGECKDIDIHVIRELESTSLEKGGWKLPYPKDLSSTFCTLLLVVFVSYLSSYLVPLFGYHLIGFIFLLVVFAMTLIFNTAPALLATFLFGGIWSYFFIPPLYSFHLASIEDMTLVIFYLFTALFAVFLNERLRKNRELLIKRERTAEALYEIFRVLATTPLSEPISPAITQKLGEMLDGKCEILLKDKEGHLEIEQALLLFNDPKEIAAATWVFENGKEAGASTDTLPLVKNLYIPLKGYRELLGIFVYRPSANKILNFDEKNFLTTSCQQIATHIEKRLTFKREREEERLTQLEKISGSLFDFVAKQFNRPLENIQTAVVELKEEPVGQDNKMGVKSIYRLERSSEGLQHAVDNIKVLAKLNEGFMQPQNESVQFDKILTECVENSRKTAKQTILLQVDAAIPPIIADPALLKLLFSSLLQHTIEALPAESQLEVQAKSGQVSVSYPAPALSSDELETIFDPFYPSSSISLTIAKKIAELQGFTLKGENRANGGLILSLTTNSLE